MRITRRRRRKTYLLVYLALQCNFSTLNTNMFRDHIKLCPIFFWQICMTNGCGCFFFQQMSLDCHTNTFSKIPYFKNIFKQLVWKVRHRIFLLFQLWHHTLRQLKIVRSTRTHNTSSYLNYRKGRWPVTPKTSDQSVRWRQSFNVPGFSPHAINVVRGLQFG